MKTPSDLFNLYESYLGIYEGLINNKKAYLQTFDPEDDDTYPEAMVVGRITGDLNQTLRNPTQTSKPAPQRKPSANNIRTNKSFSSLQFKPAPQRKPSANNIRKFQKNEVEYILDYLLDEGFTDSYEGAEAILETMSDEWLEAIVEGFVPLSPQKKERVQNAIDQNLKERQTAAKQLTAHNTRLKKLPRFLRPYSRSNGAAIGLLNKYRRNPKGLNKNNLLQNAQDSLMHTSISKQASNLAKQNEIKSKLKDLNASVEYVLDYLIDEGYTTSYESAAVMLESMSEEWLEAIIEKFNPSDYEEYHRTNHQNEADDRSHQRDQEYLDYLNSKKDIRDPHNQARGVKKKKGRK